MPGRSSWMPYAPQGVKGLGGGGGGGGGDNDDDDEDIHGTFVLDVEPKGCANPGSHIARATKFCMLATNFAESLVCKGLRWHSG